MESSKSTRELSTAESSRVLDEVLSSSAIEASARSAHSAKLPITNARNEVLSSSRPVRAREKISYSDFYKLGSETSARPLTDARTKDQSNILKFSFKGTSKGPNAGQNGSHAITFSSNDDVSETKGPAVASREPGTPSSLVYSEEDVTEGLQPNEARVRAMTSPLSSVPSDLDEHDDTFTQHQILVGGDRSNGNLYHLANEYSAELSETSTAYVSGKKRAALPNDNSRGNEKRHKSSKRIKISSPAKQKKNSGVELGVLPQDLKARTRPDHDARMRVRDDDQGSNDGHCSACQGTGKLLCCDDCPKSFHFTCIEPPIEEADIPDEPFFCMSCWDKRYGFPRPEAGLFHELLSCEITRDPLVFQLPVSIRSFFDNVSTGDLGIYQETKDQKILRKDRHGFVEEQDPYRLRDRQNRPILCYKCGESALGTAGIISCDHCTAHWHFDCVDPPLHGCPTNYRKWMCPLHASDVTPVTRRPRQSQVLGVSLSRGFKNNGDIDVDLMDEKQGSDSDTESDEEDHFRWAPAVADIPRVKYKLPSKGILLDFLDTCHQEKDDEGTRITDALQMTTGQAFDALVEVVLQEVRSLERPERSTEKEERVQFMALQSLIALKGKEKLMAFLTADN